MVADNTDMQVSSIGATSSRVSSGSGTPGAIANLQKQIKALTTELKDLAASDMDAKAKETQRQLLQSQIEMLQAQIAVLQQQRQQADTQKTGKDARQDSAAEAPAEARRRTSGLGQVIDTYA